MPMVVEGRRKDPFSAEWMRLIAHTADRTVIGDIGFIEPPDAEGNVEFGYSIVPEYRGKGYATEAARAIIEWAFKQLGVKRVTADCLNDNYASIRVLEKAGMRQIEPQGDLLRWERVNTKSNGESVCSRSNMRFITFRSSDGRTHIGVLHEERVVDIS